MNKKPIRPLTPKQAKFVEHYLAGKTATDAAVAVGYVKDNASSVAWKLQQVPAVKQAIDNARKHMVEKGVHNLEKAMVEAEKAMQFAEDTENANAYVKAVELRAKLNGLLVEKHDVRQVGFSLVIHRHSKKAQEEQEAQEAEDEILEAEFDVFS